MKNGRGIGDRLGESSNGRTVDSGSISPGSNPGSPATVVALALCAALDQSSHRRPTLFHISLSIDLESRFAAYCSLVRCQFGIDTDNLRT